MSATIAGLLILAVFLAGVLMMFRSTLFGNVSTGSALREAAQFEGEQSRTEIKLTAGSVSTAGGNCILTVTGDNDGVTSISNFDEMDVIVQMVEGNNPPQSLTYNSGDSPTSTGDWAKDLTPFFTSDAFQPGIFNPGETIVIQAKLSLTVAGDSNATMTVAAPNGVTGTRTVSLTTPCP